MYQQNKILRFYLSKKRNLRIRHFSSKTKRKNQLKIALRDVKRAKQNIFLGREPSIISLPNILMILKSPKQKNIALPSNVRQEVNGANHFGAFK